MKRPGPRSSHDFPEPGDSSLKFRKTHFAAGPFTGKTELIGRIKHHFIHHDAAKVHLPEFRTKVALEGPARGKAINEIGQQFGLHPAQVGQRQKKIHVQAKTLFEGHRGPQPIAAHSEPDRRYGEIGHLKTELDRLKKGRTMNGIS